MFRTTVSPRIVSFIVLGMITVSSVADTTIIADNNVGEMVIVHAVPSINEIEIGIGYVSDDAYHFGRYNGLNEEGPYFIGNINAKGFADSGEFWRLRGIDLGLDSRYLRLDAGVQGKHAFYLEYDQLPDYENNTGLTPFRHAGDRNLTLPENFSVDRVHDYLLPFDQETERKHLKVGAKTFFKSRWEMDGSIQHETKKGTDWIGSSMGLITPERVMEKTTGALLPEPVDFETNKIDAALRYHGKETQLNFVYHGSLFYNDDPSLTWQDPFDLDRTGDQALEPDNQMHQLSATLGHRLSPTNRLTAMASVARLTQDEDFLPYRTSDDLDALPRSSLDGEIWLVKGQVKLVSRPMRKLRLSAQYSYDDRNNKTPTSEYYYYIADGLSGEVIPNKTWPAENDPLSITRNQLDLTANYRINSTMSLRGGYQYKHTKRDSMDQEREKTEEQTLSAKWSLRATPGLDLSLYGDYTNRTGSDYHTRRDENPAMRTYYLADVDRIKLGASLNYMVDERLTLGMTAEYLDDDYTDSVLGLTEAQQPSLTLDASYLITDSISSHAFYTYEEFNSANAGSQDRASRVPDWNAEIEDTMNSLGFGIDFNDIYDQWDAGANLVFTRSRGSISMANSITTNSNPDSNWELDPIQQFPDLRSSLNSLQIWGRYKHSDKLSYQLNYWYEDYSSEDWTVDDLDVDSTGNVLLLGEERLDYNQHVVGLSVHYRF